MTFITIKVLFFHFSFWKLNYHCSFHRCLRFMLHFPLKIRKSNSCHFVVKVRPPFHAAPLPALWQHVILWEIAILIERNNIPALGECQRCSCSGDMQWIMLMQWRVWSGKVNIMSLTLLYIPGAQEAVFSQTVGIMMLDRGWQSLLHLSHVYHQLQAALSAHTFKYGLTPQWRN